jgi:HK97 family phage portal protein
MSFWNDIFQRKSIPSKVWSSIVWGKGWESYNRWDKKKLITQGYERSAPFYAAANIIAQTVADIPVYVDAKKNGQTIQTESHPILSLLERDMSRTEFIERMTLYLVVTGETYAQIVFAEGRVRPLGLICLPSQNINPVMGDNFKPIKGFRYIDKSTIDFDFDEIVYICKPSLQDYFNGMSPGVALSELVDLNNAAITWNKNIALAGGMPLIVATGSGMTPEEAQRVKDGWQDQSGANNAHRLKIVSENLELKKLNDIPHDAEWSKAVEMSMRMIFMAFGVSSELMNDAGNKTYSNYREARKALYMEASIPLARKIYGAITKKLSPFYRDSPKICLDVDKIESIQEDRGFAVERLTKAVMAGILTPNEAREELNYTAKDGGDKLRKLPDATDSRITRPPDSDTAKS